MRPTAKRSVSTTWTSPSDAGEPNAPEQAEPQRQLPVSHLTAVELRWLFWGFEGVPVDDPWFDHRDGQWFVDSDRDADSVLESLRVQGDVARSIIGRHDLNEIGRPGERWDGADPATLECVLLHLVQEYARHAGHLDVVVEMANGRIGEE